MIIGCDFHPGWRQIAWLDGETGETRGTETGAASGDAGFYQQLAAPAQVGMEATGNSQWFIELVQDLGHEVWIGDAAFAGEQLFPIQTPFPIPVAHRIHGPPSRTTLD